MAGDGRRRSARDRAERTVYEPRVVLRRIESALLALGVQGDA